MPERNIFAFDRSGFNGFLFANIGMGDNGSSMTVLSALAQLGQDPWATTAGWAGLPEAQAAKALAACIAQMPIVPEDLRRAPDTAARLVRLLSPTATAALPVRRVARQAPAQSVSTNLWTLVCMAVVIGGVFLVFGRGFTTRALRTDSAIAAIR